MPTKPDEARKRKLFSAMRQLIDIVQEDEEMRRAFVAWDQARRVEKRRDDTKSKPLQDDEMESFRRFAGAILRESIDSGMRHVAIAWTFKKGATDGRTTD